MEEEQVLEPITLKKITDQLTDAVHKSHAVVGSYQEKLKALEARESAVIEREGLLKTQTDEFSMREQEVKKVEDVVALKKQADALLSEGQDIRNQNKLDKEAFENFRRGENSRLVELRITIQKEADNNIEYRKKMDDEVSKRVKEALKNMGIKV